ncbi:MAG: hypothetical protein J7K30_04445 [Deltaproteobacteria bacterium]|nr:hypothetical protein [Deltaproteobacteria bacterium]
MDSIIIFILSDPGEMAFNFTGQAGLTPVKWFLISPQYHPPKADKSAGATPVKSASLLFCEKFNRAGRTGWAPMCGIYALLRPRL